MSDYRVHTGTSVALVSLTVLSPQPMSTGIQSTRRDYSGNGFGVIDQGLYVELVWEVMKDATAYQALLTTFGLASTLSAIVTVNCRDDQYAYHRYNGIAIRPAAAWSQFRPRNVTILIRDLVLI
jgi:hypothetical protein